VCFGKASAPDTAGDAARAEALRQGNVRDVSNTVNQTFDSKFGPDYYHGVGDAYRGYMQPQLDSQFRDARRATALRFGGNSDSSAANRTGAQLQADYNTNKAGLESSALDAENQAKQQVEAKRSGLLNVAETGGSLENTAAQARAITQMGVGQPSFQPIGDLFGKYVNNLGTAAYAQNQGYGVSPMYGAPLNAMRPGYSAGAGSQRIVG